MIILVVILHSLKLSNYEIYEDDNNNKNSSYELKKNSQYIEWETGIEESLKLDNQAYLINFTAAWCITCQANDKIALSRPKIKKYMKENNINYIVADWTNKNQNILRALEAYNRNGVPLYIFWKPGMDESKILPAILTEQILLDTFENDIISD